MRWTACDREPELRQAMRGGALPEDLRRHVSACERCKTAQGVGDAVLRYAGAMVLPAELPAAAEIWRRAQERRRAEVLQRTARAMLAMRALAGMYLLVVAACVLRTVWMREPQQGWQAMHLIGDTLRTSAVSMGVGGALLLMLAGAMVLGAPRQRREAAVPML